MEGEVIKRRKGIVVGKGTGGVRERNEVGGNERKGREIGRKG